MGNAGGVWQMLSLTVRHRRETPMVVTRKGVTKAWRRARQGGSTQRIWKERVTASARATDVTHGRNGWHVHLHVLIRTSEWTDDDRDALLGRWKDAVRDALGDDCVPDDEHAIRWSTPINACTATELERAAYLVKLGAELVSGDTKTRTKNGSRTPWQILADAIAGDAESVALWREFTEATKGARAIELDDRAARFAREELAAALGINVAEPIEDGARETVTVPVAASSFRLLRAYEQRFDPTILSVILSDVARSERPEPVVARWLAFIEQKLARAGLWYEGETAPWFRKWRDTG